jgi:invasion protein IalB
MFRTNEIKGLFPGRGLAAVLSAALVIGAAAGGAQAQQKEEGKAPEAAAAAADPNSSAWIKICNPDAPADKNQCLVTQELRDGNTKQLVAAASIRTTKGEKTLLILSVPIGVLLPAGLRLQIDDAKPQGVTYTICFPTSCVARMEVDDEMIAKLKAGNKMVVSVLDAEQKAVSFPITLAGFTKTFDGPPVDPEVFAQAQQKLAEEIQKRAEEMRKEQEEAQSKAQEEKAK